MSKAPSMPLFCGDYLADTKTLSLEQHGAYLLLLMITWRNSGKALPDDSELIARSLGVTKDRWLKKIRPALVPMFDLSGGAWRSPRLEREWNYVQEKIAIKRENGGKGGRPPGKKSEDSEQKPDTLVRCNINENKIDNSLKNNDSGKAIGSLSVNLQETTQPSTLHLEESKKEYPPTPLQGDEPVLFDVPATAEPDKPKKARKPKARYTASQLAPFLEQFESAYPVSDGKQVFDTARRTFANLVNIHGVAPEALLAATNRFRQDMQAKGSIGTKWIKLPNNWLREGEWKKYDGVHPFPVSSTGRKVEAWEWENPMPDMDELRRHTAGREAW